MDGKFPDRCPEFQIAWVVFDLGDSIALEDMYIWNGNQTYPTVLGRGFGVVDIAVSNDGGATYTNTYTALSLQDARVLNPGLASGDFFAATDILDMSGITADHIRIVAYPSI